MSAKRKNSDGALTFEQINGAYGLVLGALFDSKSPEDWADHKAGWVGWNDPRIQAAALRAAKSFLDETKNGK